MSDPETTKHFTTWNKFSLLIGVPLFGYGVFHFVRFIAVSAETGSFGFPGFGSLALLLVTLGIGGLALNFAPTHFMLDKAGNSLSSWDGLVVKRDLKSIPLAGKTGFKLTGFYPRRSKTKSYRLEVVGPQGAEELNVLATNSEAEQVKQVLSSFFGLPVEGP